MKTISSLATWSAAALLALVVTGCASSPHGSGPNAHANMTRADMQAMCDMHKKMMAKRTPAEQQAMMQDHMKSMTPEMRQRMQTMHDGCK
jgi:hypothetical protein